MLRIKELAEHQGLNITNLANRAEMAYSQVHGLWSGRTARPALTSLAKIAAALEVSVGELFTDDRADGDTVTLTVRLPADLHEATARTANDDEQSVNAAIIVLLREALAQRAARPGS
jgi:hypothetical protein